MGRVFVVKGPGKIVAGLLDRFLFRGPFALLDFWPRAQSKKLYKKTHVGPLGLTG